MSWFNIDLFHLVSKGQAGQESLSAAVGGPLPVHSFPSVPECRPLEGPSSQLHSWLLGAQGIQRSVEVRVWMPCICYLLIFTHGSFKDLLIGCSLSELCT